MSSTSPSFSVREAQTNALISMLNLNQPSSKGQSAWKVLVYDQFCQRIISPLLNVGQLREQGVTLHLNLNAKRLSVPDVPAVYFIQPTKENVDRICKDLKENLYDQFHINFVGSTPRALLERLAESALESDSVSRISKVHDQFLGFQSLSPSLFTLAQQQSYVAFNDPKVSDAQAQANIERCVEGLFAALSVCAVVPVIRCPRNGAAEMVARALSTRLNEHVSETAAGAMSANASSLSSFRRPVLVLLERSVDLAAMMHHPWTYGAMVHDVLNLSSNRVKVSEESEADGKVNTKTFDLDAKDTFWASNSGAPFQQVAVEVKQQLSEYQSRLSRLDSLRTDNGANDNAANELGGFVSEIPELQAKKAMIEKHTNIATALLRHIKQRELDRFYSLEETLLARGACDRAELRRLLTSGAGTRADRTRLLLIYYLCAAERAPAGSAVATEFARLETALEDDGADLTALQYVRQARSHLGALSLPTTGSTGDDNETNSDSNDGASWMALQKGYDSLSSFTSIFSDGVDRLKSLLPREQELPVTRIVRSLMEHRPMKGVDQYLYFDPKVDGGRSGQPPATTDGSRSAFREAVVFVIGGGNYTEYQNLLDYATGNNANNNSKRSSPVSKSIVYGSTELLTADLFVEQLKKLTK